MGIFEYGYNIILNIFSIDSLIITCDMMDTFRNYRHSLKFPYILNILNVHNSS